MSACNYSGCIKELPQQARGRPRRYCSDSHRVMASRARSAASPVVAEPIEQQLLAADDLEQLLRRRTRRASWTSSVSRSRGRSQQWWRL
jgi:hypothetical protein